MSPCVQFFSESLIFSPTAHFLQVIVYIHVLIVVCKGKNKQGPFLVPKEKDRKPEDQWSCKRSPESAEYTNKHV